MAALKLAFDQALILGVAFNHDLGYKTLHKAVSIASSSSIKCCLCYWALAYLSSPNINRNGASTRLAAAKDAVRQASRDGCLDNRNMEEESVEHEVRQLNCFNANILYIDN